MKVFKQSTPFTCGACTYLILTNKKYSKKIEREIHKMGVIKPTNIFLGPSFKLAREYLKDKGKFIIYSKDKTLGEMALNLMVKYENVPKKGSNLWKRKTKQNYNKLMRELEFHKVKNLDEYINKIKNFLSQGKVIALLLMMPLIPGEPETLHWVSVLKYENLEFVVGHSWIGKEIKLSEEKLKERIKHLSKKGFPNQFLIYEKD